MCLEKAVTKLLRIRSTTKRAQGLGAQYLRLATKRPLREILRVAIE